MKTIAITVDEPTLRLLDEIAARAPGARSRSALVREALHEYAARERSRRAEAQDREVFRKHRRQLSREARALVAAQARP